MGGMSPFSCTAEYQAFTLVLKILVCSLAVLTNVCRRALVFFEKF